MSTIRAGTTTTTALTQTGDTTGTITLTADSGTIDASTTTGALALPVGTTAQRPSTGLVAGMQRWNTTTSALEIYNGTTWGAQLPAGTVLQVASAYKTDTQTISSGTPTFVDITGLTVTLTPRSTTSKFLCMWSVPMGNGTDASHGYVRLNRNGTAIALADASGNKTTASSLVANTSVGGQTIGSSNSFLDSPATAAAVTYKLTASNNSLSGGTTFINRSSRDTDLTGYDGRSTSSFTVMEIAG